MPPIPKIVKDSCVITVLVGSWFLYLVMSSTLGSIDHYQSPPENERIHRDLVVVHATTVVLLEWWTKLTAFFGVLYILD